MPRLVILLNKPLWRYYGDDKYLKGLNNINTIISINIHSFIIESPALNISLFRPLIQYYLLKLNNYIYKSFKKREISKREFFGLFWLVFKYIFTEKNIKSRWAKTGI